jgi:hypothetical protein
VLFTTQSPIIINLIKQHKQELQALETQHITRRT